MKIEDYATEEIEKELERRREISKMVRPKPVKDPNLTELIARCEEYIDLTRINDSERFDYADIILEEVILAIYGEGGLEYINYCEKLNSEK